MFDGIAPRLAALGYHVVAVDFRGHGDSGPLDTGFAWTLIHLDTRAADPSTSVGDRWASSPTPSAAARPRGVAGVFPELVRWVVNIDGLGPPAGRDAAARRPDPRRDPAVVRPAPTVRCCRPRRPWASVEEMAAYREPQQPAAARRSGRCTWRATALARSRAAGCGRPTRCSASASRASSTWRCSRPRCAACECPVLVLTGDQEDTWREHDRRGARGAGRLAAALGTTVVAGTGHYVHIEDPDADDAPHRGRSSPRSARDGACSCTTSGAARRGGAVARRRRPTAGWSPTSRATAHTGAAPRRLRPAGPGDARPLGAGRRRASWSGSARTPTARSILAAGGGCDAVAIVDGLWGAWQERRCRGRRRCTPASAASSPTTPPPRPPPPSGLDPRTQHGYGVTMSPSFAQSFWGADHVPAPGHRDARLADAGGGADGAPELVRRRDAARRGGRRRCRCRDRPPS